jgi:hypothetical protein
VKLNKAVITDKSKRLDRNKGNIFDTHFHKVFWLKDIDFVLSLAKKCLKVKGIRYTQKLNKALLKKLYFKALLPP